MTWCRLSVDRRPFHSCFSSAVRKYASGDFAQSSSVGGAWARKVETRTRETKERRRARKDFMRAILASDFRKEKGPGASPGPWRNRSKLEPDEAGQEIRARRLEGGTGRRNAEELGWLREQSEARVVDDLLLVRDV